MSTNGAAMLFELKDIMTNSSGALGLFTSMLWASSPARAAKPDIERR